MDFDLKHSLPDKDDPFLREIFHLCFHILPVMDTMPVRFLQSMICIEYGAWLHNSASYY